MAVTITFTIESIFLQPLFFGMKIQMRQFYMNSSNTVNFAKSKSMVERKSKYFLALFSTKVFVLSRQTIWAYVVILSKMGLSDGVSVCWPLIGTTTFAATAIQLATLIASSLPEDDHRFRTHSIKVSMLVAILTDRII